MDRLLPSLRRELRARAHHLHPVVSVGQHGLTPSVLHEIDVALTAHELVKIRVFGDDRAARESLLGRVCDALGCAAVQVIGKLLVVWRPRPPGEKENSARARKPPVDSAPIAASRVRKPSKAPPGVPRAAPRRRRRAP